MRNTSDGLTSRILARLERLLTALVVTLPAPRAYLLLSPKARRRALGGAHWKAGIMACAAVFSMTTGITPAGVAAATPTCPTAGGTPGVTDLGCAGMFEMDGNQVHNSPTVPPYDWAKDASGNGGLMNNDGTPVANSTTGAIANTGVLHDYAQPDGTYFATSDKDTDNSTSWQCGVQNNVLNKDNLLNAYAAVFQPTTGPRAGHRLLYVASERETNNGDAFAGFWLLANPTSCTPALIGNTSFVTTGHSKQDILLRADYTNGGTISALSVDQWNGSGLTTILNSTDCQSVDASVNACGRVNSASLTPPWANSIAGSLAEPAGDFVEVAVDLTALGVDNGPMGQTLCTSTFLAETRSSQESGAQLKDFTMGAFDICKQTSVTTQLSATTISTGDTASDTAQIHGATSGATGTVTYKVYTDNACTALFADATPANNNVVNGVAPNSSPVQFTSPGTYYWQASYSGDLATGGVDQPSVSPCQSEILTVVSPTLTLSKTTTTSSVSAGATINYTVTVTNTSQVATANGVTVSDTLPTNGGLSWTISSQSPANSWTISGGVLSFGPASLGPGQSASATITSPTTAATCGTVTNSATSNSSNDGHPSAGPVAITVDCPTQTATQLSASSVSVGDSAHDTATVTGASPGAGGSVSFAVYTDANCSVAATTGSGNDISAQPAQASFANDNGTITATSSSVTFQKSGTYYWQATYSGDAAHNTQGSQSPCQSEILQVLGPALSISKTADATPVSTTQDIGFTITVSNSDATGTGTAHSVTLNDPLPAGTGVSWIISPAYTGPGTCSITGSAPAQVLSCAFGDMAPGASVSVHVLSHTTSDSAGTYPNTATASAANAASVQASATIVVLAPDLTISKTADQTPVTVGSPIGFTITVSNSSAQNTGTAFNVKLSDPLPAGSGIDWAISPAYTGPGTCSITGSAPTQVLSCSFGDLAPGAGASVHILSPTTAASAGTYPNTATASADNNANVAANASITVLAPSLSLTKTADHSQAVPAGTVIGFVLTLDNGGPGAATGVLLTDTLPSVPTTAGAAWVLDSKSLTGADLSNVTCLLSSGTPQVLTCGLGSTLPLAVFDMASGDRITVHLTHATDGGSPGVYPNTAQVASTNITSSPLSASAQEAVLSLTTAASGTVAVGQAISDVATIHGGNNPTGTITFHLYGPGDSSCTGTDLVAGNPAFTVALSNGTASSPTFTSTAAGTYQWVAEYSGDASNMATTGKCGDPGEEVVTYTTAVQAAVSPVQTAVTPAQTGDWTIFTVLGAPLVLIGIVLLALSRRRKEGEA